MLRWFVALLVLANLLFFAWTQGWLDSVVGARADGEREPERLARQVRPDSIRLLAPEAASAASAAASARPACFEAGPFASDEIGGADAALQSAMPPEWRGSWTTVKTDRPGTWIIYMGKFANREALQKKADELRRLKLVFDEVHAPASLDMGLSLGRFDDKAAADRALVKLGDQGIHTARVAELSPAGASYMLRVASADAALAARLMTLKVDALGKGFVECAARSAGT